MQVNDERKEELKRQALSATDAEMDRGHKKKTNSKLVISRDNPGYNPFQETQTQRNNWTVSSGHNNASRPFNKQIYRINTHNKHSFHKGKFNRNANVNARYFNNTHFQRRQMNK